MTPGERMVWAAEFVRAMGPFPSDATLQVLHAIRRASALVDELQAIDRADLRQGEAAKLDDMLGWTP